MTRPKNFSIRLRGETRIYRYRRALDWRHSKNGGELHQREKVMRGLERKHSPVLTGYKLFHDYIRPHKAPDYKTPAQVAGIEVKGKGKWKTLIQNASWNE
jgi:hypothetical protein